ncbi:hypothetical protein ACERK3_08605 [Phycisphaerales bacterium AB-hyl4]|uniref:Cell division protein FtsL n=1 Tax=Natronomicrosphaera hydrolytica TaxID=3242702 RepID=A0ABV4U423_9BACT
MFPKLFVAIVFAAAIGAVLLGLRQHRLEMMHDMVRVHREMDAVRQQTWDLQVRIAERLEPEALRDAVERADLSLEPAVPPALLPRGPVSVHPRVAEIEYEPRPDQR